MKLIHPAIIMSLLLSWVAATAQATPMSEQNKKDFIRSGIKTCFVKQRQDDPLSEVLTDSQVNEHCGCVMTRATDFITLEDLGRMLKTKDNTHLTPIMETASDYCIQVLSKKWGWAN